MSNDTYISLISSLPIAVDLFKAKQTPLSRLNLEKRLRVLDAEDAELLKKIEDLTRWLNQPMDRTDADFVRRAKLLTENIDNEFVVKLVQNRLELRTVVAALRRRKRGDAAPALDEVWGVGRWVDHIRRFWNEPDFRLASVFPWIIEANRLINTDDSLGLERLILNEVWQSLGRASVEHYFDFEAVIIYVMRWDVIARWTSYDGEPAIQRFNDLVTTGLGEHAQVFAEHA